MASQPGSEVVILTVTGRETFYVEITSRIVTETYLDTEVSVIVQDLMGKYAPDIDVVTHIDVTTTTPDDIRFPYRPLKECLDELARISGFTYYCTPDLKMHWVESKTEDSGFTYVENDIDITPELIESLLPIKNRVYVIGGDFMQLDREQSTVAATRNTKDKWYAQSFTPTRTVLNQISLHLKRTGAPADLVGEIRTDAAGPATVLVDFLYNTGSIGVGAGWVEKLVTTSLLAGEKYWIVLKKTGDGVDNYEWSHDNDTAGEYADSDDGATWVVHDGGDNQFAYRTYFEIPILAVASDPSSMSKYSYWRETVIEDKSIFTRSTAREIADSKLAELVDLTAQLREINIVDPVGIPVLGKLVTITLPDLLVTAIQYVAKTARLVFMSGQVGTNRLTLGLGREASDLATWLRDLKVQVDITKIGAFGVATDALDLIVALTDSAEATDDNLVGTVQLSGTFLIDTAIIGFSDIG